MVIAFVLFVMCIRLRGNMPTVPAGTNVIIVVVKHHENIEPGASQ